MELPDELIEYHYQSLLAPPAHEGFSLAAEMKGQHFLSPGRFRAFQGHATQVRSQVAGERDFPDPPPELQPLDAGFIDLPQRLLDDHRRKQDRSELGRILSLATRLRDETDRVLVLGVGGSYLGARALFDALCHTYHNELPERTRLGTPRIYFEGNSLDNDTVSDLLEVLENNCLDPDVREERWGMVVVSKSGATLETAVAYRAFFKEASRFYSGDPERRAQLIVPVTGTASKLRDLCLAQGIAEEDILTMPEYVGGRFSVFTAAGLLPAAVMGLDVRALLLGAAAMTKRFLEEPFDRNPVLQYAAVNHLMAEECGKRTRVLAVWSKKLESLGHWYDQLVAESLGKGGRGPTPLTVVMSRDLHARGQQQQDGTRDKVINNLVVRQLRSPPLTVGMADHNQDELNGISRRTMPELMKMSRQGMTQAYADAARPTADLVMPQISEYAIGQLLQMLMLATVAEARMLGVNPYGQPGVEPRMHHLRTILKNTPNVPAEVKS